jgi:hypothetical protein
MLPWLVMAELQGVIPNSDIFEYVSRKMSALLGG